MSGGHWGYQSYKMEEEADHIHEALLLLAKIEHELDRGYAGDTCSDCAERRTLAALSEYFGRRNGDYGDKAPIEILDDWKSNQCPRCEKFWAERERKT